MTTYKHPIEVRFCDLDSLGHVNNAVYLSYLEQARISWLQKTKMAETDKKNGRVPLILAKCDIDFVSPIFWHDKVNVEVWLKHIGNKSFHLQYNVYKNEKYLAAKAFSVQVYYNYIEKHSTPIPDSVRIKLQANLNPKV